MTERYTCSLKFSCETSNAHYLTFSTEMENVFIHEQKDI